jgi:hypothetical protein
MSASKPLPAVVAMPTTLAGRIAYTPKVPARVDQLTQRVPHGGVIDTHAVYAEPFWRAEGLSGEAVGRRGLGQRTSLTAANRRGCIDAFNIDGDIDVDIFALLFDPQTNGGLLAALSPSEAVNVVNTMRVNGVESAAIIGRVIEPGTSDKRLFVSQKARLDA